LVWCVRFAANIALSTLTFEVFMRWWIWIALLCVAGTRVCFAQSAFEPSQVAQTVVSGTVPDTATVQFLQDNFDVWLARPLDDGRGALDIAVTAAERAELARLGFRFTPNAALSATLRVDRSATAPSGIAGFSCYRTVEETFGALEQLAANYPTLARTVDIGASYLQSIGAGGYPIKALIIENTALAPANKPTLMLIAAIHAREYATAEVATRFAERLLSGYAHDPELRYLLDSRRIVIVPQVNPDGRKRAEAALSQRRNLRSGTCATDATKAGVDLNRNSSFFWGANGSSLDGCSDTYRGALARSEPEVQAIEQFLQDNFPDRRGALLTDAAPNDTEGVFISLHSFAEIVLFPWSANASAAPNKAGLQTLARKFGYYTGYQVCQGPTTNPACLYAASGTTDDQAYGDLGIASFTFELGRSGFFEPCATFEATTANKASGALLYALKAARRPYIEPAGPEVTEVAAFTNFIENDSEITVRGIASDLRSASAGFGSELVHDVVLVRMYVNTPPEQGATGYAMAPIDGSMNSPSEAMQGNLPLAVLRPGRNVIYITATDASGATGIVSVALVRPAGSFTGSFE
jgi:carboxypeptidase T